MVDSYTALEQEPAKIPTYFDHIDKVEATDKHTVVFTFKQFNAEWDYRFGWGYYSAIVPKEVVDAGAKDWKNANGTGPFMLDRLRAGQPAASTARTRSTGTTRRIGGKKYKLPFVDKITYRIIKDEATYLTALRTGKLDVLESIRWSAVDELKKNAPQLQVDRAARLLGGTFLAHARRHQAVRRHPRAPRAEPGGQQAGDRQGVLRRQRRALRLSDAPGLHRLLRAAGQDAARR